MFDQERVDFIDMDIRSYTSIKNTLAMILEGTHVLIDDTKNFMNYLRAIRSLYKPSAFHFSNKNMLVSTAAGWIFPKQLEPEYKESITLNLLWLVDIGFYQLYEKSTYTRMYKHLPTFKEVRPEGMERCRGRPMDRR